MVKKAAKGSNKGQDEANEQLTYETDPHLLFPTLTLRQRQVYETRGSFTIELTKGCISRYHKGIAYFL
jgi:hypothetical protein